MPIESADLLRCRSLSVLGGSIGQRVIGNLIASGNRQWQSAMAIGNGDRQWRLK